MNLVDVVILATLVGTGVGGWRLGFVSRVFVWAGVVTGLAIAVNFVPRVVTGLGGTTANSRVGVALGFLFLAGSIGQAVGLVLGLLVHRVFPIANPLPLWDHVAGAVAGTGGLLALTWLVTPSLAVAEGWPAREIRSSKVVTVIEEVTPHQPASFAAWGLAISQAPYPSALDPLATPPDPGKAPTTRLSPRGRRDRAPFGRAGDRRGVSPDPRRQWLGRGTGNRRDQRPRRGRGARHQCDR